MSDSTGLIAVDPSELQPIDLTPKEPNYGPTRIGPTEAVKHARDDPFFGENALTRALYGAAETVGDTVLGGAQTVGQYLYNAARGMSDFELVPGSESVSPELVRAGSGATAPAPRAAVTPRSIAKMIYGDDALVDTALGAQTTPSAADVRA